ncbi:MAG: hypothetical protein EA425_14185 [Puniceicoccaceae bacterium]|nr:MAG: hypothetical protein EA425_14185 [Puniceicoccaceae bacterium]
MLVLFIGLCPAVLKAMPDRRHSHQAPSPPSWEVHFYDYLPVAGPPALRFQPVSPPPDPLARITTLDDYHKQIQEAASREAEPAEIPEVDWDPAPPLRLPPMIGDGTFEGAPPLETAPPSYGPLDWGDSGATRLDPSEVLLFLRRGRESTEAGSPALDMIVPFVPAMPPVRTESRATYRQIRSEP